MNRRTWVGLSLGGLLTLPACAATYPSGAEVERLKTKRAKSGRPPLTEDDIARLRKFRNLKGGEKFVDAFEKFRGVEILDEDELLFYSGTVGPKNNSRSSYGSDLGVPAKLRATWRIDGPEAEGMIQNPVRSVRDEWGFLRVAGGIIVGDYTVPVADRIPQQLLDELPYYSKQKSMGFRLKLRLHDEGLLVGWDVANSFERAHVGGDFEEAHVVYQGSPPIRPNLTSAAGTSARVPESGSRRISEGPNRGRSIQQNGPSQHATPTRTSNTAGRWQDLARRCSGIDGIDGDRCGGGPDAAHRHRDMRAARRPPHRARVALQLGAGQPAPALHRSHFDQRPYVATLKPMKGRPLALKRTPDGTPLDDGVAAMYCGQFGANTRLQSDLTRGVRRNFGHRHP